MVTEVGFEPTRNQFKKVSATIRFCTQLYNKLQLYNTIDEFALKLVTPAGPHAKAKNWLVRTEKYGAVPK